MSSHRVVHIFTINRGIRDIAVGIHAVVEQTETPECTFHKIIEFNPDYPLMRPAEIELAKKEIIQTVRNRDLGDIHPWNTSIPPQMRKKALTKREV